MPISRKVKSGGDIFYQSKNAPTSSNLERLHLDQRVIPIMGNDRARNIPLESKYFDIVQPIGQNYASQTQNYHVDADSSSMISLADSYFVVNFTSTDSTAGLAPPNSQKNNNLFSFASHLFCDNINLRVSGTDISDSHPQNGTYAYSALNKKVLIKPKEEVSSAQTYPTFATIFGGSQTYLPLSITESVDAPTTLECLGIPTQTLDSCMNDVISDCTGNYVASAPTGLSSYLKNLVCPMSTECDIASVGNYEFILKPSDGAWNSLDYLPTGVQLDITLSVANISKWIQAMPDTTLPTIVINTISLYLARVKPTSDALTSVNQAIMSSPFTYPISYSRTETYQIPTGTSSATISCLQGVVPNALICFLVATDTYNRVAGNSMCHPFSSGALQGGVAGYVPIVSRLWAICGSTKFPQQDQYLCNASVAPYQSSVQNSYLEYRKMCVDYDKPFLSFSHWVNHFQIFCINTTSVDSPFYTSTDDARAGSSQIKINFGEALHANFTLVITGLSNAEFAIDKTRSVIRTGFA